MDSLFLMQRYWGSDEEKGSTSNVYSSDDKSKSFNKKQNLDKPIIDIDNDDEYDLPNKKQKLDYSVLEISSEEDSKSSNKQRTYFSYSDSDIEIINEDNSKLPKNIKNKTCGLNGTVNIGNKTVSEILKDVKCNSAEKAAKSNKVSLDKCRYFNMIENDTKCNDTEKAAKSNEKVSPEKCRYFSMMESSSSLSKKSKNNNMVSANNNIGSKVDKKQLKLQEINSRNTFPKQDVSNIIVNKVILPKNMKNKTSLNGIIDANETELKIVKQKMKNIEFEENSEKTVSKECGISKSQETENIDRNFCTIGQIYQQKDETIKHALPHWLSSPTYISVNLQEEETPISELNYLDRNTKKNLKKVGISFLFPVQLAVIPWLMQSKEQSLLVRPSDICVSTPTGSGKTLAFVIPIVQSLKSRVVRAIRALVVLPTSELAIQVYKVFVTFVQGTDLKVALLTGKKSFIAEQNALVKTNGQSVLSLVDIVVTTPGRIHDHLYRTRGFCLKRLRYLVIDEADHMMEEIQQGWLKQVDDAVFRDCFFSDCGVCSSYKRTFYEPTCAFNFGFISQPLQKLLFSATLTHNPELLHSLSLYKPKLFTSSSVCLEQEYKGSCTIPPELTMLQVICEEDVKPMVICHLVKQHNFKRVLCFTETVERAHRLHLVLEEMGLLQVREISSLNRAVQRKIVLEQFSSGKVDILICSDLVARGIDIENIDCVISYDVPQYFKSFMHRIGRTARAARIGTAITLLSEGEIPHFKMILQPAGVQLPEKVYINSEDLKPLVNAYQTALSVADAKLKKEKKQLPRRSKIKRKRE